MTTRTRAVCGSGGEYKKPVCSVFPPLANPMMCWKYALHFGSTCDHHHEIPLPSSRRRSGRCRLCVQSRQHQSYSVPRRHSAAALDDASGCVLHQCQINIVVVPPTTNLLLLQSASTALVSASQQQRQQWSISIGWWVVPSKCV